MSQTVQVALVGCGRIAQRVHLRALARIPGVRVTALADPDAERLAEAKKRAPGARTFADVAELLAGSDVEALVLALPPSMHAAAATAAFAAGRHVYLEKPGATTPEEAGAVLRAWRGAGTVGMLGLNQRFHPMYIDLRAAIRRERLGEVVGARSVFCAAARDLPPWKRARATGGGVLLDLAIHHVDLARFLLDREVEEVRATVRSVRSENDTATVDLRFPGGIGVQTMVSMSAAEQDRFEVFGTDGLLAADRYGTGRVRFAPPRRALGRADRVRSLLGGIGEQIRAARAGGADPSHGGALRVFVEAVRQRNPFAAPGLDDGYRTLAAVFAAEASARLGRGCAPEPIAALEPAAVA